MRRVLITGGRGFIGSSVARYLSSKDVITRISSRKRSAANVIDGVEECVTSDLGADTDWSEALIGVDSVVHCAGLAHVLSDTSLDPAKSFSVVNRDSTLNLACQAAAQGVKRFIFLSSAGVHGANSMQDHPFSEIDVPAPFNEYTISKLEAENALLEISKSTGMEVVIIRPPLVYGYAAPGNFALLVKAVRSRVPLPLGSIKNLRSMIFVGNLVDFIFQAAINPRAANQIFLIGDDEDLPVNEVIRNISKAMKTRSFLVPVPFWILRVFAKCLGRHSTVDRLCCTFQIDSSKARKLLGWSPPFTRDEGFSRSV
jgi:nucleoside-diphosphate-sugar epimerase